MVVNLWAILPQTTLACQKGEPTGAGTPHGKDKRSELHERSNKYLFHDRREGKRGRSHLKIERLPKILIIFHPTGTGMG